MEISCSDLSFSRVDFHQATIFVTPGINFWAFIPRRQLLCVKSRMRLRDGHVTLA